MDFLSAEFIGLVLGVVALIGTIIALGFAFKQTRDLKVISGSLSTKFLGVFPDFMAELTDLVGRANEKIVILCDLPAYGVFSAGEFCREYTNHIERLIAKDPTAVQFICLNGINRAELHKAQFKAELTESGEIPDDLEGWERWKNDSPNPNKWKEWKDKREEQMDDFLRFHGRDQKKGTISYEDFLKCLGESHHRVLRTKLEHAERANVRETNFPMSIYFWIRDGEEALLTIRSFTGDNPEVGFRTSDPKLLEALTNIYEGYRRSSEPIAGATNTQNSR